MEKTITFSVSGNEITGRLHGNAHCWIFESESEFFKTNCNDGKLAKHTALKNYTINNNLSSIYSRVCEEAEIPGF